MRLCRAIMLGGLMLAPGAGAASPPPPPTSTIDIASAIAPESAEAAFATEAGELKVEATYDPARQSLAIRGYLRTSRTAGSGVLLSCNVLDPDGTLLGTNVPELEWQAAGGEASVAVFDVDLPVLWSQPSRQAIRIDFAAAMDAGAQRRPDPADEGIASVVFINIPPRDHFEPLMVFAPRLIPSGVRCRIPSIWRESAHNAAPGLFVGSLDVVDGPTGERIDQRRIVPGSKSRWKLGRFVLEWQVLSPLEGPVLLRPGLVSDDVRWYEAEDWFQSRRARPVSPVIYASILIAATLGASAGWRRSRGIVRSGPRIAARLFILAGAAWLALHAMTNGYWVLILVVLAMEIVARRRWSAAGARAYFGVWLFVVFLEIYWGQIIAGSPVRPSATLFSAAAWAIVLTPLLIVRNGWARRMIGFATMVFWLAATAALVGYHEYFQDYPSIENLLYAGQLGHLGDSIRVLLVPEQWVPALMLGAFLLQLLAANRLPKPGKASTG